MNLTNIYVKNINDNTSENASTTRPTPLVGYIDDTPHPP